MWLGHTPIEIKLTGAETGDAFAMFVDRPPAGWSLPPHRHLNEAETIYIAEGEFEMTIGEAQTVLGPGDVAHVPAGVVHAGRSLAGGRRVLIFSPSGIEQFFLEACTEEEAELDVQRFVKVAESYGWRFED